MWQVLPSEPSNQHASYRYHIRGHQGNSRKRQHSIERRSAANVDEGDDDREDHSEDDGVERDVPSRMNLLNSQRQIKHFILSRLTAPSQEENGRPLSRANANVCREVDAIALMVIMMRRNKITTVMPVVPPRLPVACLKT